MRGAALLLLACALALALPGPAGAQAFRLGVRFELQAGAAPYAVALDDVNGDGAADLTVANYTANSVWVRLGDGKGGFATNATSVNAVGTHPEGVVVADVNGDGFVDLVVPNNGSNTVSVLPGAGTGLFGAKTDYATGSGPSAVAVGDVNDDGRPDLVVANFNSNTVSVLLANGGGGFLAKADYATAASPVQVVVGDVSGDGRLDIAVADFNAAKVSVLLGTGSGAFGTKTDYTTGTSPRSVALGDVDGDGDLDLVVPNYGSNTVSVLAGNGAGSFAAKVDYVTGTGPTLVAIGDLDRDGSPDLAVTSFGASTVSVLQNDTGGAFESHVDFAAGSGAIGIAIADINGDGFPDLATANNYAANASILLGKGTGYFGSRAWSHHGTASTDFAIGDLNRDGLDDAVLCDWNNSFWVLPGDPTTGLAGHTGYATPTGPMTVAVGDMDGDGFLDVVTANSGVNTVSWYQGNGAGSLGTRFDSPVGTGPYGVVVADLRGVGRRDLVSANTTANTVSVLLNNGFGYFATKVDYATGSAPIWVAAGDLNHNGRPDLVTANFNANTVSVLLDNGGGTFQAKTDYAVGTQPRRVAIADLNSDGRPDLVVANDVSATISVLLNNGSGAFGAKTDFANAATAQAIAVGDVNGDGRTDVLTASYLPAVASLFLGDGAGSLMARDEFPLDYYGHGSAFADVNGDGRMDLLASDYSGFVGLWPGLVPTRVALAVSPDPVVAGGVCALTATVSVPAPGRGTPTGTVSFYDGTTPLGTANLTGGVAFLGWFPNRLGRRSLTAVYSGDAKFFGGISARRSPKVVASARPAIASIQDLAKDQGGEVRLRFRASPLDFVGSPTPIVRYDVFRRIVATLATAPARATARPAGAASALVDGWDFVGSVSAYGDSAYNLVVPTLADSNASGVHRLALFVRAATGTATVYYDSAPDSGYSVDNLAPATPTGLGASLHDGMVEVHWNPNTEPDLAGYRLHRGATADFVPGPGNLESSTADTYYRDENGVASHYKVAAVDVNGNVSGYATLAPEGTLDAPGGAAVAFALEGPRPNPSPGGRMAVTFALPTGVAAELELLDVSGRRVWAREVGTLGAGRHTVELGAERRLAPGVYLVKLTQGGARRTTRVTVLR